MAAPACAAGVRRERKRVGVYVLRPFFHGSEMDIEAMFQMRGVQGVFCCPGFCGGAVRDP